jgi:hypothetical protein
MDNLNGHSFMSHDQRDALLKIYYHPILRRYGELGREMGHGGMDFIMDSRLVYCLHNGLPLDMDVYDMAEWCCLAELGALSMDNNSAAVAFPDFTRGHWMEQDGYHHAYAEEEVWYVGEISHNQRRLTNELGLWRLYDEVVKARAEGDAKAEAKAQRRLDAAKSKVRKEMLKPYVAEN